MCVDVVSDEYLCFIDHSVSNRLALKLWFTTNAYKVANKRKMHIKWNNKLYRGQRIILDFKATLHIQYLSNNRSIMTVCQKTTLKHQDFSESYEFQLPFHHPNFFFLNFNSSNFPAFSTSSQKNWNTKNVTERDLHVAF